MIDAILEFWFGPVPGAVRTEWFRKDAVFDAGILARFGSTIETALTGGFMDWRESSRGSLARVLLLDQFTRNAFRDTARSFAGDADAVATAEAAIEHGFDQAMSGVERWFLYMPFEHAESHGAQAQSLKLFGQLAAETGLTEPLEWAEKHAVIIARFGRYPHRNSILGRASTAKEVEFLIQPGSRF